MANLTREEFEDADIFIDSIWGKLNSLQLIVDTSKHRLYGLQGGIKAVRDAMQALAYNDDLRQAEQEYLGD